MSALEFQLEDIVGDFTAVPECLNASPFAFVIVPNKPVQITRFTAAR